MVSRVSPTLQAWREQFFVRVLCRNARYRMLSVFSFAVRAKRLKNFENPHNQNTIRRNYVYKPMPARYVLAIPMQWFIKSNGIGFLEWAGSELWLMLVPSSLRLIQLQLAQRVWNPEGLARIWRCLLCVLVDRMCFTPPPLIWSICKARGSEKPHLRHSFPNTSNTFCFNFARYSLILLTCLFSLIYSLQYLIGVSISKFQYYIVFHIRKNVPAFWNFPKTRKSPVVRLNERTVLSPWVFKRLPKNVPCALRSGEIFCYARPVSGQFKISKMCRAK